MIGCPIRKSTDLAVICTSPRLIAACHVLHRLYEPRHPPYALNYFLLLRVNLINKSHSNMSKNFSSSKALVKKDFTFSFQAFFGWVLLRRGFGEQCWYTRNRTELLNHCIQYLKNIHLWIVSTEACLSWLHFHSTLLRYNFRERRWRIRESNPWPLECKSSALANWANPPLSSVALAKEGISSN